MRQRERLVPLARGRVLEVGVGSGLNFAFYDTEHVSKVWGLDPSPEMTKMAIDGAEAVPFDVEFVSAGGEDIPMESDSVDTVLITYTLCTIPEPGRALDEMSRVLKSSGRLLFCEHGVAPDASVQRWQKRMNPVWKRLGGGCSLNRNIPDLIRASNFDITEMQTRYMPGWRPASFNYWGTAVVK